MDTFKRLSDGGLSYETEEGHVVYVGGANATRAVTLGEFEEAVTAGDVLTQVGYLSAVALGGDRLTKRAESLVCQVLANSGTGEWAAGIRTDAARALEYSTSDSSAVALRSAFEQALERLELSTAVRAATSLYRRADASAFAELVSAAKSLSDEELGYVMGWTVSNGLPAENWPENLVEQLSASGSSELELIAARARVARGDQRGIDFCMEALNGTEDQRLLVVSIFAAVSDDSIRVPLLRKVLEREQSTSLRLKVAVLIRESMTEEECIGFASEYIAHRNPVLRLEVLRLTDSLPAYARRTFLREWSETEVDDFIRSRISETLTAIRSADR